MTEGEPDGAEYDEKHVELLWSERDAATRRERASAGDDERGGEYSYS